MKTIPEALKSHLQGEAITLCRCWILETTTGERIGFTDHDKDIVLNGVLCARQTGVEAGSIEESVGINVNSSDFSGALQSEKITERDIEAGVYDNAEIKAYLVNWSDVTQYSLDRISLVGEIKRQDGYYSVEMRGLTSILDQTKGRHFSKRCQADLGDARCKLDINNATYQGSGSVLQLERQKVLIVDGLGAFDAGWFCNGRLSWSSGPNSGRSIDIVEHSVRGNQTYLTLWETMPREIGVSDQFQIWAGCDKSFETCKAKFANSENFRGFPHLPGNDEIFGQAPKSQTFNGEPLVP